MNENDQFPVCMLLVSSSGSQAVLVSGGGGPKAMLVSSGGAQNCANKF